MLSRAPLAQAVPSPSRKMRVTESIVRDFIAFSDPQPTLLSEIARRGFYEWNFFSLYIIETLVECLPEPLEWRLPLEWWLSWAH